MFARSIAALTCILSLVACAGSEPTSNESAAATDQAATDAAPSCGANYGKALAQYKEAVALAKQHKTSACEGVNGSDEGAYLSTIASKAIAATTTCGAFSNVIKTSPWAAPIREELAGSLVLPFLTGDLDAQTFKGLAEALPGVTLWGPASGVYGNQKKLEFAANGALKISTLEWPSEDAKQPEWVTVDATYTIGAAANGSAKITITQGATKADFTLKFVTREWDQSPDFEFQADGGDAGDLYTAYYSECEA